MRIGHGYDVHRLVPGRKLILGGVEIPFERGLDGHSDADVLTHALMDALLGAACLGDIGLLFPDNDPQYKGISSLLLLEEVVRRVHAAGFAVGNADITVLCQRPKLRPHIPAMQERLRALLGTEAMSRRRPRKASALRAAARASPATPCVCWRNAHENASDHRL